jgi:hypothetical protein
MEGFPLVQRVQQRCGADKLAVVLLDVDPGFFSNPEEYLPRSKKILARHKVDWPNAIAPNGFKDTVQAFNLSGYGNVIVDAKGIVRGANLHGKDLERLLEEIVKGEKVDKPGR